MKQLRKIYILLLKKTELGSAVSVRLTKLTGKSKEPIHPKHFLTQNPWFSKYLRKDDVVLDLGCGNGQNTIKAARKVKKVIGIEYNSEMIKIAKSTKQKNVVFRQADLEKKVEFKENKFDVVLLLDVLEHLHNRNLVLMEIKRILKPKGKLLLGVPNSQTSWKKRLRSVGLSSFSDPDHKIEFSERQIRNLLKREGYRVEQLSYGIYDTPYRGLIDIVGGLSINLYKLIYRYRKVMSRKYPHEGSGFEIVATPIK